MIRENLEKAKSFRNKSIAIAFVGILCSTSSNELFSQFAVLILIVSILVLLLAQYKLSEAIDKIEEDDEEE